MARLTTISLPTNEASILIEVLATVDGVLSFQWQRGASIRPAGDTVLVVSTTTGLRNLLSTLGRIGLDHRENVVIGTSELSSVIAPSADAALRSDASEATWEEMATTLRNESTMSGSLLLVMAIAGVLATVGIIKSQNFLVIAAMLIAPGFEPLVRFSFGIVHRHTAWHRGLLDTAKGYASLILAATATAAGYAHFSHAPSTIQPGNIHAAVSYWASVGPSSALIAFIAGFGGAILIATNRSVLTAGAMVALSLIPAAAIVGMGIATASTQLILNGIYSWLMNAGLVVSSSLIVLMWHYWRIQRRRMIV